MVGLCVYTVGANALNSSVVAHGNRLPVHHFGELATTSFSFLGDIQYFVVPAGVTSITVTITGASGGDATVSGQTGYGGKGGVISNYVLTVFPGETLHVYIGGQGLSNGEAGFNGGGDACISAQFLAGSGGGASDVRREPWGPPDRLIVAGGGGGGYGPFGSAGGNAGYPMGSAGTKGSGTNNPGGGALAAAGGSAGGGSCGSPGALGLGGSCCSGSQGPGGGGGYYGGGTGQATGAGGGNSYAPGTPMTSIAATSGPGSATFTYTVPPSASPTVAPSAKPSPAPGFVPLFLPAQVSSPVQVRARLP